MVDITVLNNVWIIICAIFIFFMQAGFAMLESGLVRSKNAVNVIMKNYIDMSAGSIAFWVVGFGLMFGANNTGFFGTNMFVISDGEPATFTFLFFQMMFAATAATIVSGALAERIRYWPYIFCAVFISSFIYPIFGSWVWGSFDGQTSGWLKNLGFIDFAGSAVVHAVGGWCALAGILVLGPRVGRFGRGRNFDIPGHNLPIAALGAFILWFGFFAFNAGSALDASANLGRIILNTHLAGAAGVISMIIMLSLFDKRVLFGYTVNGGLGGLVAICAGAAFVSPIFALATGFVAGAVVFMGMSLMDNIQLDDPVGAVPVHAFAGTWGVLAVGLFNESSFFNLEQLGIQALGALVVFLWAFPTAWIMFKLVSLIVNLRVSMGDERRGLDYSEHKELGYPEFQEGLLNQGASRGMAPVAPSVPAPTAAAPTTTPSAASQQVQW